VDFSQFKLHPQVAAGVTALGYTEPTPIQVKAIPPVLAGQDVIGLAQTGTGKTAAFGLPILQRLNQGPRGVVRALIIAPTRELADQINDTLLNLGRQTRLRSMTLYGGVGAQPQIKTLKAGVEIVVACPGRLLDHMNQGNINLSKLEVLVLDEADRMFDMGFLPDVRRIIGRLPKERQTLLFSATMPDDVSRLAHDFLRHPVRVQANFAEPLNTVAHALYPVMPHLKTPLLLALLARTDTDSVLIFMRTKHRAKKIAQQLKNAGYRATALQGNLSQNARQAAMQGFRDGSYQIMVATDIAARGLDVSQISHVINYDIPDTVDAYTHRIGRTGRAARTGDAFTLVTPEDQAMVQAIERALGKRLERRTLRDFDYAAPAPPKPAQESRGPRPGRGPEPARARRPAPGPAQKPAAAPPKPTPDRARQPAPAGAGTRASTPRPGKYRTGGSWTGRGRRGGR
jgi:ATP-dependent RNA helicase RhlE